MEYILIEDSVENLTSKSYASYQAYVYCYKGECDFVYNDRKFTMSENTCAIFLNNKRLKKVTVSGNCEAKVLYLDETFVKQSGPSNPYVVQAMLALFENPLMKLDEAEQDLCLALFRNFRKRLEDTSHHFHQDILRISAEMFMLDMLDFHARTNGASDMTASTSTLMARFIQMLENKEYRENREVAYYAEKLCVVPKYLSEISNKVSGYSASYWINKYASQDIHNVLKSNKYTVAEVAKMFNFTSSSYFNRYVKRSLGMYPSEIRDM